MLFKSEGLTHVNLQSQLKQTNAALVLFMDTQRSAFADVCSVYFFCENKSSLWVVSGYLKVSDGTQA